MAVSTVAGPRRAPLGLYLTVVALFALAVLGGLAGYDALRPGPSASGGTASPGAVTVRTSFGSLTVGRVHDESGPTHGALGGASHGVGSLVPEGQAAVQTWVSLTNTRGGQLPVRRDQFRLLVGDPTSEPLAPSTGDLADATLGRHATIEGTLSFVTRATAERMYLRFQDADRGPPVLIDLGLVRPAPVEDHPADGDDSAAAVTGDTPAGQHDH